MDKNRIRGLPGRTSEPRIAKSASIKGRDGKSGPPAKHPKTKNKMEQDKELKQWSAQVDKGLADQKKSEWWASEKRKKE